MTGAGGSIGSELCKQISDFNPKLLILIEWSEINLYQIKSELFKLKPNLKIKNLLANASDKDLLKDVFNKFDVKIVFHAAAYKHVS